MSLRHSGPARSGDYALVDASRRITLLDDAHGESRRNTDRACYWPYVEAGTPSAMTTPPRDLAVALRCTEDTVRIGVVDGKPRWMSNEVH